MSNYTENKYIQDANTPWYKIIQNIDKAGMVLDIGCSSGNLGKAVKEKTKSTVIGVEIDKQDAKRASKVLDKVYVVNLETEPIPADLSKQSFDYIIFCDVIEHLVWPVETLKKVKNLLKPSGKILFSIPSMTHMSVRLMLLEGKFDYGETGILDKTHLHFYDKDEIHRIFDEAGYFITSFDWVSQAFPEGLIEEHLNKLGLTPKKDFFNKANDVSALAYQYIGAAVPTDKPAASKKRAYVSPNIHEIQDYVETIQEQLSKISKQKNAAAGKPKEAEEKLKKLTADHIRNLEALNKKQAENIEELSQALDRVYQNKALRLARNLNSMRPKPKKESSK